MSAKQQTKVDDLHGKSAPSWVAVHVFRGHCREMTSRWSWSHVLLFERSAGSLWLCRNGCQCVLDG